MIDLDALAQLVGIERQTVICQPADFERIKRLVGEAGMTLHFEVQQSRFVLPGHLIVLGPWREGC